MKDFSKYSAIIIGAGDATGSAITKKFASHGYKVCPARRPRNIDKLNELSNEIIESGGWSKGFGVDARDEDSIKDFLLKWRMKSRQLT
jgi:NAD(P)-dependent dehydrogenase (short-subunit alcohol dehydrogenase family)